MLKAPQTQTASQDAAQLQNEVANRGNLQEIGNKISTARDLDGILIDLEDEITDLFGAERLTVYVIDGVKRELVSRFKSGNEISEIRVPVNNNSLAGYSALKQKLLNISNVYNEKEIQTIDDSLQFDKSWDLKTGYKTKQMLAAPVSYNKYLLGVLQLINKKGEQFHLGRSIFRNGDYQGPGRGFF